MDQVSSQEAARILNVSEPYFLKLLENGKIPFRQENGKTYVSFEDVVTHKQIARKNSQRARAQLVQEAEVLGLEY